ncbi:MAG TPA: hypothetical protein VF800_01460 [Telluria sp.]|jgi:hypothetical protein
MFESARIKILAVIFFFCICSASHASEDMSLRLQNFIEETDVIASSGKTSKQKADLVKAAYERRFSSDIAGVPAQELEALFEATQYMMFYTLDKTKLPLFEHLFKTLSGAGKTTLDHEQKLLQMYFALREFDKANAFLQGSYHGRSRSGPISVNDLANPSLKRTVWVFHGRRSLTRRDAGLEKGVNLVIIGSPFCHFARNALAAMESSPALAPLLKDRVKLMAMQDFSFDYDTYAAWNRAHPALPFVLTHSREEWPEVSRWASPVFLFFRDGKLESQFSGWPEEGNMEKVYAGFGIASSDLVPVQAGRDR